MDIKLTINKQQRSIINKPSCSDASFEVTALYKKIEEACVRAETKQSRNDVRVLKPKTWYVAEVAFKPTNPIHRAIAFHRQNGDLELIGSYELEGMPIRTSIKSLTYFNPIHELPSMEVSPVPFLSKDAPKIIYIQK